MTNFKQLLEDSFSEKKEKNSNSKKKSKRVGQRCLNCDSGMIKKSGKCDNCGAKSQ